MRQISGTNIYSDMDNELGHMMKGQCDSGGASLPTTTLTYGVGCEITDRSTGITYQNTGTAATPVWNRQGGSNITDPQLMQFIELDQTAAQMIATTTAALSDTTNGLTVVPAAAAGFVNILHKLVVSYTFKTAAFTGGGNTTVNIGGGGAALTGLIATTSLWQSASSVIYEFKPLSTVATPMTTAAAISLKTASAITNPGTAAGSCKIYCWYSVVAI